MPSNKPIFPPEVEQEITRRHHAGERIYLLAQEYGVWPSRIRAAIERNGGQFVSFDYKFNEHAFDALDNEQACYWLGFLFADGYVSNEGLRINLKRSDEQHLYKFKAFLQAEQPIHYDITRAKGVEHLRAHIMIADRQFARQLVDLGISKDRPNAMRCLLVIPEHLRHHWFRGLFDGDGCAHKTGRLTFLAPECILQYLKSTVLAFPRSSKSRADGAKIYIGDKISRISFGGIAQCRLIADWLYNDATVWMPRKRNVIDGWTSQSYLKA